MFDPSDQPEIRNWHIRELRELRWDEKLLLFVILSRGQDGMFTSSQTAADDMGVSRRAFYHARDSLIKKGLLFFEESPGSTTQYWINSRRLHRALEYQGSAPCAHGCAHQTQGVCTTCTGGVHHVHTEERTGSKTGRKNDEDARPREAKVIPIRGGDR